MTSYGEQDPRWQANAMAAPNGDMFYPDDEHDARWFAEVHEAVPMWLDKFPFDLAEPVVRARVTLTFEVLASRRIETTDDALRAWVSDQFGRVADNGPYSMQVSPYGQEPKEHLPVSFGTVYEGAVEWTDGSAPEAGWHCGSCRQAKRVDAGRCLRTVQFRGREFPCDDGDADHHGSCWFSPLRNGRGTSARDVA